MFPNLDGDLALIVRQLRREQGRIRPPDWCPLCRAFKRVRRALTSRPSPTPASGHP
jgi:hypothetical protein